MLKHAHLAYARLAPVPEGRLSALLLTHGSMELRYYTPGATDPQTPHDRDEIYVVVSGSGDFLCGQQRTSFASGDALFVSAGDEHRFENYSDDLALWVIFYGPRGGETDPVQPGF